MGEEKRERDTRPRYEYYYTREYKLNLYNKKMSVQKIKNSKKGSIFIISFYRFLIGSLFTHHIQKDMKSISYASSGLPLICVRKSFNS